MRCKLWVSIGMVIFLCVGCGRGQRRTPENTAEAYRGASMNAKATISVYGTYPAEYGVSVWCKEDGDSQISITEPADIAGICALYHGETATLSYEGTVLETFLPSFAGSTPVDALPGLLHAVARDVPIEWGYEDRDGVPMLMLVYQDDYEDVTGYRRVWLREEDATLSFAEYYLDDSLVMCVNCTDCTLIPASDA